MPISPVPLSVVRTQGGAGGFVVRGAGDGPGSTADQRTGCMQEQLQEQNQIVFKRFEAGLNLASTLQSARGVQLPADPGRDTKRHVTTSPTRAKAVGLSRKPEP